MKIVYTNWIIKYLGIGDSFVFSSGITTSLCSVHIPNYLLKCTIRIFAWYLTTWGPFIYILGIHTSIMFKCYFTNLQTHTHTFFITSAADIPGYGVEPNVTISHIRIPKLQVSDFTEYMLSYKDSIAIHLYL